MSGHNGEKWAFRLMKAEHWTLGPCFADKTKPWASFLVRKGRESPAFYLKKGGIAIEAVSFLHSSEEKKKVQGCTESPSFLYLVFIFLPESVRTGESPVQEPRTESSSILLATVPALRLTEDLLFFFRNSFLLPKRALSQLVQRPHQSGN